MNQTLKFNISFGKRLVFFLCATLFCYIIGSLIIGLLVSVKGQTPTMLRISAVLQDIIIFIIPALITAVISTRLPATFLAIDRRPNAKLWILGCVTLIVSIPAMNALVAWNESIHLPQSMAGIETWMRNMEDAAQSSVGILLGGDSIMSLIVSILIVGVLAGFSEEIFYRGAFQRLLTTGRVNHHLAVWIVALIFSASHLQFYGFFPRLLLGAYFGYVLYWTRCLWIPVILHIFNNSVYVVGNYCSRDTQTTTSDINNFGAQNIFWILFSIVMVTICIITIRRLGLKKLSDADIKH